MRRNKRYDGTREMPKSHPPHAPHPNAHTEQELKWLQDYHRRNPNISLGELYGKPREDKSRHPGSPCRVSVRLGFRKKVESTKEKSKHNKKYDTPLVTFVFTFLSHIIDKCTYGKNQKTLRKKHNRPEFIKDFFPQVYCW